jgi:hypothetical protein
MFAITKRWNALAVTMSLVATFAAGCSGSAKTSDAVSKGDVRVAVSGMSSLQTDVVTMTLTVGQGTGTPTFPNIVLPMSKNSNGEWTGYATGIPARRGEGRRSRHRLRRRRHGQHHRGRNRARVHDAAAAHAGQQLQQPRPGDRHADVDGGYRAPRRDGEPHGHRSRPGHRDGCRQPHQRLLVDRHLRHPDRRQHRDPVLAGPRRRPARCRSPSPTSAPRPSLRSAPPRSPPAWSSR